MFLATQELQIGQFGLRMAKNGAGDEDQVQKELVRKSSS
jgi:hypothetical protein